MMCALRVLAALLACGLTQGACAEDDFRVLREAMIEEIEQGVQATQRELGRERLRPAVIQALRTVPRHEFVPLGQRHLAYENRPLPIGQGQTISQPYIVAIMTDLLEPQPGHRVLELGTGSGYQAAVLARLVERVYSIEIVPELGEQARARLRRLGFDNVEVRVGDGYYGWPEAAPFDGIIVTAAADHVPPALLEQLKPRGRLVMPVGSWPFTQQLQVITKGKDGSLQTRDVLPVAFVPVTGGH